MIFTTTYEKDNPSLLTQLKEANKYLPWIEEAATQYGLQPSIIVGIGSRESHWGLALKPEGPEGTGDLTPRWRKIGTNKRMQYLPPDGMGFGRGLLQIDWDWHEFARTGKWMDPRENILYGCGLLAENRNLAEKKMSRAMDPREFLRVWLAAYNAGFNQARNGCYKGDADKFTSGHNYSADVLNRAGWFQIQGWS